MPSFDDSSTSQRVNRILDAARASAVSAVSAVAPGAEPEPGDVWPSSWPPGYDDDQVPNTVVHPERHPPSSAGPRWDVSVRAAIAAGVLAVLAIATVIILQSRGPAPGTVVAGDAAGAASTGSAFATQPALPSTGPPVVAAGVPGSGSPTPAPALASGAAQPTAGLSRVYVVGQVKQPGVVSLAPEARVEDAVNAAGGATDRADLAVMNLARKVVDGERIVVPRPGEAVPSEDPIPAPAAPPGAASAGGATGAGSTGSGAPGSPVDLNTATVADLDALPGVGPVIASRSVDWRQQNGNFKTVDDLGEVSGIGDATLAKLRPLVRV